MGEMPQTCNTVGKYNFIWEISPLQKSVKKFQGVIATGETIPCPNSTCQGHTCTGILFIPATETITEERRGELVLQYQEGLPCPTPTSDPSDKARLAVVGFFTEMTDYLQ